MVRSKQRVSDHGEVFTPPAMVEAMLDLVNDESARIDSRFLEPACGSGGFLIPILRRKLAAVRARYGKSDFENRHYALLALMSVYGIELLADNVAECRDSLLKLFADYLRVGPGEQWHAAASRVIATNVVHGDALSMTTEGKIRRPIAFAEWAYIGKGLYRRRDFRLDRLTLTASFDMKDSLPADLGRHAIFTPIRDYPPLTVSDLASDGERR